MSPGRKLENILLLIQLCTSVSRIIIDIIKLYRHE